MNKPVIASPQVTNHILHRFKLRADKKLGQNFLIDENIVHRIVEAAELSPADKVLEVGPGIGTLTQGLAEGLGISDAVNSPTFTIVQIYEEGRIPLYHLDVYRIGDISEMDEIGYEDYFYGDGVCLIEWANLIEELLPERYVEIRIEKNLEKGFDYREITVSQKE